MVVILVAVCVWVVVVVCVMVCGLPFNWWLGWLLTGSTRLCWALLCGCSLVGLVYAVLVDLLAVWVFCAVNSVDDVTSLMFSLDWFCGS